MSRNVQISCQINRIEQILDDRTFITITRNTCMQQPLAFQPTTCCKAKQIIGCNVISCIFYDPGPNPLQSQYVTGYEYFLSNFMFCDLGNAKRYSISGIDQSSGQINYKCILFKKEISNSSVIFIIYILHTEPRHIKT